MDARIDLHVHTTASDGSCSPSEVVRLAAGLGLAAIAITDHDTVAGYPEAAATAASCGVEVVPGIEISTRYLYFVSSYSQPSLTESYMLM